MSAEYLKFTAILLVVLTVSSCAKKNAVTNNEKHMTPSGTNGQPPAYVQKAWDARYIYDTDRRLLVPQYAGSRWGAVQQYKEEGQLVYQDWWVRDVRSEDLEAAPDTAINSFLNEDGNLTMLPQKNEEVDSNETAENLENSEIQIEENPEASSTDEDPFAPSPFSPF